MQPDSAHSFFDRWEPPTYENEDCLTPEDWENLIRQDLIYQNAKPPVSLKEHLEGCKQCESILQVLRKSSHQEKSLETFLAMTRQEAKRQSQRRQVSLWRYIKAYFLIDEQRWKPRFPLAIVCLLVAMVGASYWIEHRREAEPVTAITFTKDNYESSVKLFSDSISKLKDTTARIPTTPTLIGEKPIQEGETLTRLADLNAMIRRKELDSKQYAEVVNLVALYIKEVKHYNDTVLRFQRYRGQAVNHLPLVAQEAPKSDITNEVDLVNKLYTSVDEAVARTSGNGAGDRREVIQESAPASPSKQIEVVAIEPNKWMVMDIVPSRTGKELDVLKTTIKTFVNTSKYTVRLKSGQDTFDILPDGPSPSPSFLPRQ